MSESAADIIDSYRTQMIEDDVTIAACALVLFEALITIDLEVTRFWQRKRSFATWLYFLNRYTAIVYFITPFADITTEAVCGEVMQNEKRSDKFLYSCRAWIVSAEAIFMIQITIFALFASLRARAVGKSLKWAFIILPLTSVPIVANIYNYSTTTIIYGAELCYSEYGMSPTILLRTLCYFKNAVNRKSVAIATRVAVICAELILISLTLRNFYDEYMNAKALIPALSYQVLVRDGTFYFVIFVLLNILQILNNVLPNLVAVQYAGSFIVALNSIILSRFLLSLRQDTDDSSTMEEQSNLAFASRQFMTDSQDDDDDDELGAVGQGAGEGGIYEITEIPATSASASV